jgi:hypothetical protein
LRAAGYRALLRQVLGGAADGVELLATEFNSVYANPGKQSTSLVNGLFVADALGSLLQTEYNAADVWDLRNSWDTGNNNSASLYGWRRGGDYGLVGTSNGTPPSSGTYVPYPSYFAEQLVAQMVHPGDLVVQASSDDLNLAVYAVQQATGDLELLVLNKHPLNDLTGQFQINGFQPDVHVQVWQYGKDQDTAQSLTTDGQAALANWSDILTLQGSSFNYTLPSYSMTVLDLATPPLARWSAAALGNLLGRGLARFDATTGNQLRDVEVNGPYARTEGIRLQQEIEPQQAAEMSSTAWGQDLRRGTAEWAGGSSSRRLPGSAFATLPGDPRLPFGRAHHLADPKQIFSYS